MKFSDLLLGCSEVLLLLLEQNPGEGGNDEDWDEDTGANSVCPYPSASLSKLTLFLIVKLFVFLAKAM